MCTRAEMNIPIIWTFACNVHVVSGYYSGSQFPDLDIDTMFFKLLLSEREVCPVMSTRKKHTSLVWEYFDAPASAKEKAKDV